MNESQGIANGSRKIKWWLRYDGNRYEESVYFQIILKVDWVELGDGLGVVEWIRGRNKNISTFPGWAAKWMVVSFTKMENIEKEQVSEACYIRVIWLSLYNQNTNESHFFWDTTTLWLSSSLKQFLKNSRFIIGNYQRGNMAKSSLCQFRNACMLLLYVY